MSYQKKKVFLPKDAARYPSLDRLTEALQATSDQKPLDILASAYADLDKLCDKSIERHETSMDFIRKARKASQPELRSDEIADGPLPVVCDSIAQTLAKYEHDAELAEAEIDAIQHVMMDVEARVFEYQPQTDREALNQIRFLCAIVDYLGADELARFVKAVKTAINVLWEPRQRLN